MASQVVPAAKRLRISLLLDTYGELLTEKQRTFLQRYFEEDLSFGEVAREYGVSRQAIFDSVRHGEETLERFESVLHLVENGAAGGLDRDLEILGARVESVRDRLAAGEAALPSPAILTDLEAIAAALRARAASLRSIPGAIPELDDGHDADD